MQHSGAADGAVSSTVSQVHAGCKQKSSSVDAADQTAGAGAKQPRCRRQRSSRTLPLSDKGSRASAGAYAYPREQSRSSGTAPDAPDRRDRRVADAFARGNSPGKRMR